MARFSVADVCLRVFVTRALSNLLYANEDIIFFKY